MRNKDSKEMSDFGKGVYTCIFIMLISFLIIAICIGIRYEHIKEKERMDKECYPQKVESWKCKSFDTSNCTDCKPIMIQVCEVNCYDLTTITQK